VLSVHPPQRPAAALAVVAALDQLADDEIGVVVPLLGALAELTGPVEEGGNAGRAKGAEQSELQRSRRVEREVVTRAEKDDPLVVLLGIERLDLLQDGQAGDVSLR
jgi:hypothetical protein